MTWRCRLLESGEAYRGELIKRIGAQLDRASVSHLLMPAESGDDAMYNVDMVAAILEEFLLQHRINGSDQAKLKEDDDNMDVAADDVMYNVDTARSWIEFMLQHKMNGSEAKLQV